MLLYSHDNLAPDIVMMSKNATEQNFSWTSVYGFRNSVISHFLNHKSK